MEDRFEAEGVVWTGGGRLHAAVLAALAASAAALSRFALAPLLPSLLALALVAYRLRKRTGTITANEFGVLLDGKLLLARSDIGDGYVTRRRGRLAVTLVTTGGRRLDVEVGEAAAWDLLQALELDIAQRPLRLRAESADSPELTLGDDGVVISTPISGLLSWNTQFISYRDMKGVAPQTSAGARRGRKGSVDIELSSGEVVPVRLESERLADAARLGIARMMAAFQDAEPEARLRRGAAVYRRSPRSHEELWRVVEQPSSDPSRRASAALTLGRTLRGDDRARLIEATRSAVAPVVRSTVQAALASPSRLMARRPSVLQKGSGTRGGGRGARRRGR